MKKKMFDNIKMARINFFWITWNHDMWFLRIVFDKYESKLFDESMNKKIVWEKVNRNVGQLGVKLSLKVEISFRLVQMILLEGSGWLVESNWTAI